MASVPEEIIPERDFYHKWGMATETVVKGFRHHVRRRCIEGLPMIPSCDFERALISYFLHRGSYDNMCHVFRDIGTFEPLGEQTIWRDDTHLMKTRYQEATAFILLSFNSLSFLMEKHTNMDNTIDGTGWQCLGMESVTLWSPSMDEKLRGKNGEEAWHMFKKKATSIPGETAATYEGGSFRTKLPSSTVQTTYMCGNPQCEELEHKVKTPAQGKKEWHGTQLSACARCRKIRYCSKKCQLADWKRHKTTCRS